MTFVAIKVSRIVSGKYGSAIVTLEAVITRSRNVFQSSYFAHLSSLLLAGPYFVTFNAAIARVIFMTEDDLRVVLRRKRFYVFRELVANITGVILTLRHILILRLMANITGFMCLKT